MADAPATKDERTWHRVHVLEVEISLSTVWAAEHRPNLLRKVRSQYDKGILTNNEFTHLVMNLADHPNDIEGV